MMMMMMMMMMTETSSLSTVRQHRMPRTDGGLVVTAAPEWFQGLVAPLHVLTTVEASTALR